MVSSSVPSPAWVVSALPMIGSPCSLGHLEILITTGFHDEFRMIFPEAGSVGLLPEDCSWIR